MKYLKRSARNALRARCDPQYRTDPDAKLARMRRNSNPCSRLGVHADHFGQPI